MKFSSLFVLFLSIQPVWRQSNYTELALFDDTFKKINQGTDDDYVGTIVPAKKMLFLFSCIYKIVGKS